MNKLLLEAGNQIKFWAMVDGGLILIHPQRPSLVLPSPTQHLPALLPVSSDFHSHREGGDLINTDIELLWRGVQDAALPFHTSHFEQTPLSERKSRNVHIVVRIGLLLTITVLGSASLR